MPRKCNFSPFSCTFPSQTKSILHIHFKIISNSSYILKYTQSSFNYIYFFKILSRISSKIIPTWVMTHPQTNHDDWLGFILNPNSKTLNYPWTHPKREDSMIILYHMGFYPQHLNKLRVCVISSTKTLDKGGPFSKTKP